MTVLVLAALAWGDTREVRGWSRPRLSGPTSSIASADGAFRVHYTHEGVDATSEADSDDDGVPDDVAAVLDGLVAARAAFLRLGYRDVALDDGTGGDPALDVYLKQIDANGYAYPLEGRAADGGAACFVEILPSLSTSLLVSVAGHELHHCVQYRYTTDTHPWIYEASATWEQFRLGDDGVLAAGVQVLWATRLSGADQPIDTRGSRFEYAGFVVLKHLDEAGGPGGRGPRLWEALAVDPAWDAALDRVAHDAFGADTAGWFVEHALWNAFACGADDDAHYDPDVVGCASPVTVPFEPASEGDVVTIELERGPYATRYLQVAHNGDPRPVAIRCGAPPDGQGIAIGLAAADADGVAGERVAARRGGEVRLAGPVDPDGDTRVAIVATERGGLDVQCEVSRPALAAEPSTCATSGGSGAWLALLTLAAGSVSRRGRSGRRRRS